jgi:hypothetical protein
VNLSKLDHRYSITCAFSRSLYLNIIGINKARFEFEVDLDYAS